MRAAAGAISRAARARARAHLEISADGLELLELQFGQRPSVRNLTHERPCASSRQQGRLGAMRAAAGAISRAARARARAHLEIAADGLELAEIQRGQCLRIRNLTRVW